MEKRIAESKDILRWLLQNKPAVECAHIQETKPDFLITVQENIRFFSPLSKRKRYLRHYVYSPSLGAIDESPTTIAAEVPADVLLRSVSPSGKFEAVFRAGTEGGKYAECIEIWSRGRPIQSQSVTANCKCIYRDAIVSNVSWTKDETRICFVGEQREPSVPALWESKDVIQTCESMQKFEHKPDWGECMEGRRAPTLFVYSLAQNEVKEVEIPFELQVYATYPVFDPADNIVFVGLKQSPIPRGLFGTIKPSSLYRIKDLLKPSQSVAKLSGDDFVCSSPHFSPDGSRLVYFCVPKEVVSHSACYELRSVSWSLASPAKPTTVVPIVKSPKEEHGFPGISGFQTLFHDSSSGFVLDSNHFIFNAFAYGCLCPYIANLDTGKVTKVEGIPADNAAVLSICKDLVLLRTSSYQSMPFYALLKVSCDQKGEVATTYVVFGQTGMMGDPKIAERVFGVLNKVQRKVVPHGKAEGYLYYVNEPGKKQPLLTLIHGGPHSTFFEPYFNHVNLYLSMGYAVLILNYRGSTGHGQDMLDALVGHIADVEIEDAYNIINKTVADHKDRLDPQNLFLGGYSYGGFMGTWLLARYPKFLRAAVLKNPACSVVDLAHATDIPDWPFGEALGQKIRMLPTAEEMQEFFRKTPLYQAGKIVDPVLIMLGEKDARVPNCSGKQLHRVLRAQNTPTRLLSFPEDNHSLTSMDADENGTMNAFIWFETYMHE